MSYRKQLKAVKAAASKDKTLELLHDVAVWYDPDGFHAFGATNRYVVAATSLNLGKTRPDFVMPEAMFRELTTGPVREAKWFVFDKKTMTAKVYPSMTTYEVTDGEQYPPIGAFVLEGDPATEFGEFVLDANTLPVLAKSQAALGRKAWTRFRLADTPNKPTNQRLLSLEVGSPDLKDLRIYLGVMRSRRHVRVGA